MGKVVVGAFITLDGVVQAPGAPDEDREGGFEHGGWTVPFFDEALAQRMVELTNEADAVLLGRKTYEIFIQHWPHIGDEDPIAAKLNSVPKYVASRTLEQLDWRNSTLLRGDVAEEVAKLKDEVDGTISVTGSGDLVQTLLKHDLVDEFQLLVFPVVTGTGKRLFGEGATPGSLRLVESETTGTGVTVSRYERAGALEYGAIGLETEAGTTA
jgi:dihydrofolate reductase